MDTLSIRAKIEQELLAAGWRLSDDGFYFAFIWEDHECIALLDDARTREDGTVWMSVGVSTIFTRPPTEDECTLVAQCAGRHSVTGYAWESGDEGETRLSFAFSCEVYLGLADVFFKSRVVCPFLELLMLYTSHDAMPRDHAVPLFMLDRACASIH